MMCVVYIKHVHNERERSKLVRRTSKKYCPKCSVKVYARVPERPIQLSYFYLRQHAAAQGRVQRPHLFRKARRDIACMLTLMKEVHYERT